MAKKYDLVIIGGGPGGYTAALRASALGMTVALVEQERLGGTCLNRGCIPTKALLYASSTFAALQTCDHMGVSTDFISFDFAKMQEYKKQSVDRYLNGVRDMCREYGIVGYRGKGKLRRGRTVEVTGENGKEFLEAGAVILAAGAKPRIPAIPGVEGAGVMTSDDLLSSRTWNYDRLTIIGGGVIGVEFATIFNNLCSKVTILETGDRLLAPMDREVCDHLERELERKGITVHCGVQVTSIEGDGTVCRVRRGEEEFEVRSGRILLAAGREPVTDGLLGEDVSLEMENGHPKVDGDFRTSEPGVYAIGDLVSDVRLAHVAAAQATYTVEKIAGRRPHICLDVVPGGMFLSLPVVPSCIYTSPEIASVGLTEEAARQRKLPVVCGRYDMRKNGKCIIAREESGFIRLVFEAHTMTIVGAQIMCARATDMIGEMATAIVNGMTAAQLSMAMRAHPTYGEGIGAAIEDAMRERRD